MKRLFFIFSLAVFHPAPGQDDFLSVYNKISKTKTRQNQLQENIKANLNDSVMLRKYLKQHRTFLADSVLPIAREVINLTFPDVSFVGPNNKAYSVSDFSGKELIINYNYLYCQGCLNRIDSTLKLLAGKNVQMLVLFLEPYQKEIDDIKVYGDNVMIGFINEDNSELISFGLGDNCMYYLNENRQVEFFDRVYPNRHEIAWNDFLKKHVK